VPDKHAQSRLKKDLVIWLATCGRDGSPHAVPVWFWWDGKTFLIYSVPGQKVRDIEANPNVALHLNTDPEGEDVVRVDGKARIDPQAAAGVQGGVLRSQVPGPDKGFRLDPKGLFGAIPRRHPCPANPLSWRVARGP
jgi:PPOX class probable F420-dependent enzyme